MSRENTLSSLIEAKKGKARLFASHTAEIIFFKFLDFWNFKIQFNDFTI